MSKKQPFAAQVKIRLIELGKTQKWLIEEIHKDTGMYIDSSILSKVYRGTVNSPRIMGSMRKILNLPALREPR